MPRHEEDGEDEDEGGKLCLYLSALFEFFGMSTYVMYHVRGDF